MVLKANLAIYAPRIRVWDSLTSRNGTGQYVPGVATNQIIEPGKSDPGIINARVGRAKWKKAESTTGCA